MEPNTTNGTVLNQQVNRLDGPVKLLSGTWSFFVKYWKTIVPIILIPGILFTLGQMFFISEDIGLIVLAIIFSIAGLILSVASSPATINAVHRLSTEDGVKIDLKQQYKFGFKLFWSVVLVSVIQMFVVFGGLVLFIVPGFILIFFFSLSMFTLVIEDKRGFSSPIGSYELIRGRWFGVFGRLLLLAVVFIVAAIILSGFGYLVTGSADKSPNILTMILSLIINAFTGSFSVIYLYKLYISLKSSVQEKVPTTTSLKKWFITFMTIGIIFVTVWVFVGGAILGVFISDFLNKGDMSVFSGEDRFLPVMDNKK